MNYKEICDNIKTIKNDCDRTGKLVFTNGCFDILHLGHISTLTKARELAGGDGVVVVGLNSDNSIKRLKGNDRPINTEVDRAILLSKITDVDIVVIFEEDTPQNLINELKPDIIVKGGDYKVDEVVGADIAQIVIADIVQDVSTSNIIKKIKAL